MLGIITGSGFYDIELENKEEKTIRTPYGDAHITLGEKSGQNIAFLSRHGKNHERLSNMVNYKANIYALSHIGVTFLTSTTVCGITNKDLSLGKLLLFEDLFLVDNRLPNGEICTFYTKEGDKKRAHYLFDTPFSKSALNALKNLDGYHNLVYGHVNGPRFNSKAEINFIKNYADAISQTCGPETILAGELGIPHLLLGFGIDYANGIKKTPTPIEILNENLQMSKQTFHSALETIISLKQPFKFENFLYLFE